MHTVCVCACTDIRAAHVFLYSVLCRTSLAAERSVPSKKHLKKRYVLLCESVDVCFLSSASTHRHTFVRGQA